MNPLTNMKNVKKLSEQELKTNSKTSWHDQYKDSAWVFVGGLPYDLTEGDIICIFSQYGEIVNINLIRDKDTGKSKGFCFICYEDQRSTILAVDNFNGIKILGRTLRVDHVSDYKVPKEGKKTDEETKRLYSEGCAPQVTVKPKVENNPIKIERDDVRETLADQISGEIRLPPRLPIYPIKQEKSDEDNEQKKEDKSSKRKKKEKKKKSKKKKKSNSSSEEESSESDDRKTPKHKKSTVFRSSHRSNSDSSDLQEEDNRKGEETHEKYKNDTNMENRKKYFDKRKRYDLDEKKNKKFGEQSRYERSNSHYKDKCK